MHLRMFAQPKVHRTITIQSGFRPLGRKSKYTWNPPGNRCRRIGRLQHLSTRCGGRMHLDQIESDWIGLDWIGLDRIGSDWIALDPPVH